MCGIVGMIVKGSSGMLKQTEETFMELLYADALRGEDSTGIIGVEKDTTFHVVKEASSPAWFIPQFAELNASKAMWATGKAYIGHNRKKTVGEIADETAHPFVYNDEFAMVHNGTLTNHRKLANTDVDSEALTIHLGKAFASGKQEDVEEALREVNGAYALAMYDQRSNVVRLLRNSERPMSVVETNNAWYFASEGGLLWWVLSRNGYTKVDIQPLPVDTVMTFDLDKTTVSSQKLTIKKPMPPITALGYTGATQKPATTITSNQMSKAGYKRFKRARMGTKIEFWAEDFIETNFPARLEDGETSLNIMGVCDDIFISHIVRSTIDYTELGMDPVDILCSLWTGTIAHIEYDPAIQRMYILVANAQPTPKVVDADYIRRKLDEQETQHILH